LTGEPALGLLDIAIIVAYLGAVLIHGLWSGRRERGPEDYFLAGRSLPWFLIGASLYASNMSGASFVGLIGASYEQGLTVFNYEWTAAAVLIVFAAVMLPVFLRNRLITLPEYLERRFDVRSRRIYAAFSLLTLMFIDISGALFAGGLVISLLAPGLGVWPAAAAVAIIAGVYTIFGGLRAVVVTDAVQAVLMIVGAALVVWIGLDRAGGWEQVMSGLDAPRAQLIRPHDDDFLPWTGLVGILLLGFYYWTINQYFVQRALAARTLSEGRKGALFGGLLKLPNIFFMVVPGLIAFSLYPQLERPDLAFPTLIVDLLPAGVRGLVVTALVAAIMSSLDSAFNAGASIVTMDFVKPLRPETSDRALLMAGRLSTVAFMAFGVLVVPLVQSFSSLFSYFQSTLAYITPPVVAVFLAGLLSRRVTAAAAFVTLAGGIPLGLALFVAIEVMGVNSPVHYTVMAALLFGLALASLAAVSAFTPQPAPEGSVFAAQDARESPPGPWYLDYRWQSAGLALLTVGLLAALA